MNKIKDSLSNFRKLFEQSIKVDVIAEFNLCTCKNTDYVSIAKKKMEDNHFDILPIEDEKGIIDSYIQFSDIENIENGICQDYAKSISPSHLISDYTSLLDLFSIIKDRSFIFVIKKNKVSGIVTKADLHKLPVRIFLFGIITLLEMHLLRLINIYFPNDESWKKEIKPKRLDYAENLLKKKKDKNEETTLVDCLQMCDKRDLILKSDEICEKLSSNFSKKKIRSMLTKAQDLRDNLAHSQKNITNNWSETIELISDIEKFIELCEKNFSRNIGDGSL